MKSYKSSKVVSKSFLNQQLQRTGKDKKKIDPSINLSIFLFTYSLGVSWVFIYKLYHFTLMLF